MQYIYSDFIARLNNAKKQHFKYIYINNSKLIKQTLEIMYDLNLIYSYFIINNKMIKVYLKYVGNKCNFRNLELVSLPSKRINYNAVKFIRYKGKSTSVYIISTRYGLKTNSECMMHNLYGEVLLKIDV